jgi:PhnB protein
MSVFSNFCTGVCYSFVSYLLKHKSIRMNIPSSHQPIMPYLMLNGAAAFAVFAKKVFNAELTYSRMREDGVTPMHCELQISGCTIMFCEATAAWPPQTANLFVYVPDADATYALAIAEGAETVTEMASQDYGRSGGVKDPFGNTWWITSVK